jgi:hypothetical protein
MSKQHGQWPPYHLLENDLAARAEAKLERLERLYHLGQSSAWDGRKLLGELIAKHGKPVLPPERRESALKLLSVLLWGELAAWAISADLAERIDDIEAKMAATSQAHDEARHFYVLRDYLHALGHPVPHLGGFGRRLLLGILETDNLAHKLIGMQLLTESNALSIFRGLAEAKLEPVLTELLPYYERDESRHVGLGVLYLPRLLQRLGRTEALGLVAFQIRSIWLLIQAGMTLRDDFAALGMNVREMASHTMRLQEQILRDMRAAGAGGGRLKGLVNPQKGVGPRLFDFFHPPAGDAAPVWHKRTLSLWSRGARVVDRLIA